jgi:hypothetical protein
LFLNVFDPEHDRDLQVRGNEIRRQRSREWGQRVVPDYSTHLPS